MAPPLRRAKIGRLLSLPDFSIILSGILLIPALTVILDQRDIGSAEIFDTMEATGFSLWLQRTATITVVGLAGLHVALFAASNPSSGRPAYNYLFIAFIAFWLTNSFATALMAETVNSLRYSTYALLLFAGAYYGARHGDSSFFFLKGSLAALCLASLILIFLRPEAVCGFYAPEVRLPFVTFRLWGLASSPNSLGPLGLLLFLLVICHPFKHHFFSIFSISVALAVILLAQSKTTWFGFFVSLGVLVHHSTLRSAAARYVASTFWIGGAMASIASVVAVLIVAHLSSADSSVAMESYANELLSGRGELWSVATRMYIENPLFGFGPSAWGDDFRANHGMSFAFHAHNQVLHTLSVSGVVGFAGLTFYFIALSIRAFSLRHQTSGVSVAMVLGLIYPRMLTEVPLNVDVILSDNLLVHLAVFYFLCAAARGGIGSLSTASRPDRVPASPADRAFFTR